MGQPSGRSGNPQGTSAEHRRQVKSLALQWRELTDFADLHRRLMSFACGRDPDRAGEPVEPKVQLLAIEMLLNRTHGQAAQFVVVDAQVRSESDTRGASPYAAMSPAEIIAKRDRLLAAGTKRKQIIDVASQAVPTPSGADDEL